MGREFGGDKMISKWLKCGVWSLGVLGTLVMLFYVEENWRGARAWKACEAELRALGEPLTVQEFLPDRPSDESNMAMAPVFAGLFDVKKYWSPDYNRNSLIGTDAYYEKTKQNEAIALPGNLTSGTDPALGQGADLKKIREACEKQIRETAARLPVISAIPATLADGPFLLEAMRLRSDLYRQVEEAVARPYVYWPLSYGEGDYGDLPQFRSLLAFANAFNLRAVASLDAGKPGDAYRDWLVVQRLAESQTGLPLWISPDFSLTMENYSMQVLWEGLRRRAWSHAQLRDIEARLVKKVATWDFQQSVREERAGKLALMSRPNFLNLISVFRSFGDGSNYEGKSRDLLVCALLSLRPQGWLDLEKWDYAHFSQDYILSGQISPGGRYDVVRVKELRERVSKSGKYDGLKISEMPFDYKFVPDFTSSFLRSAQSKTKVHQAILACALERYRRSHGSYAERLEQLEVDPRFRRDPVTEGDMVYRKENGGYLIYSVGWNLKDDGGAYDPKKINAGDWPWRMPMGTDAGRRATEGGTNKK
jgi:hypothetical protein